VTIRVPVTAEMNACADLIEEWYRLEGNNVGGALHIVVDDNNVETGHIVWCLMDGPHNHRDEMYTLACALLDLTLPERFAVTAVVAAPYIPYARPRPEYVDVDEEEI
jgi:hypothetical protein